MELTSDYLYLFEDPSLTDSVEKAYRNHPGPIFSFSLQGKLRLEKRGVPCYFPDELVTLPDMNRVGRENWERTQTYCKLLDQQIAKEFSFLGKAKSKVCQSSFFYFKVFFDALFSCYLLTQKMLEHYSGQKISVFHNGVDVPNFFDYRPRALSSFMIPEVFGDQFPIQTITAKSFTPSASPFNWVQTTKTFLKSAFQQTTGRLFALPDTNALILMEAHDIYALAEHLQGQVRFLNLKVDSDLLTFNPYKNKGRPLKLKLDVDSNTLTRLQKALLAMPHKPEFQTLSKGFERLYQFAHDFLSPWISSSLTPLLSNAEAIQQTLEKLNLKMMLTSECRLDLKHAYFLEQIKALQIPVVTYQEGGGIGYVNWPLASLDVIHSDYFLTYGKSVENSPLLNQGKACKIAVGSIRLENIKKKLKSSVVHQQKCIYVMLDSIKPNTWQHYPGNGGFFTQAYRYQQFLLKLLTEFKEVSFVLKTMEPYKELYEAYLKFEHITLETRPTAEILDKADAFIIENPSTVFLECLLTDCPIAVLYSAQDVEIETHALESLKKRVRLSSNPDDFPGVIQALIQDMEQSAAAPKNQEFLHRYCRVENVGPEITSFFNQMIVEKS
ncbi:hypothetical protein WDW89_12550 [Deltaproteobacteria bacterium TL4]